jgi:hypothetical protein
VLSLRHFKKLSKEIFMSEMKSNYNDIDPDDAYPQYNWNSLFYSTPEKGHWYKAYTFDDKGVRIAISLYFSGTNIYNEFVWKQCQFPLKLWNNRITHWAHLLPSLSDQYENRTPLEATFEKWLNDDECIDMDDSDKDMDDSTIPEAEQSPYGSEAIKEWFDNNEWAKPLMTEEVEQFAKDEYNVELVMDGQDDDADADPTSLEWQACRLLINAGYRGYTSCYKDQGGNYRLTPNSVFSLDVDATEELELATGTPNHLAQILTLENYIRDPDNLMIDIWKQSAAECNDPVKDEYGHGIDLIQLHDARYRTVINCCRIVARQCEEENAYRVDDAERFNTQCAQFIKDWNDGAFIEDVDGEYFDPYNNMEQLALVMQIVSSTTGRAFIFDQGDFEMSMIRYVMKYASEEYVV